MNILMPVFELILFVTYKWIKNIKESVKSRGAVVAQLGHKGDYG